MAHPPERRKQAHRLIPGRTGRGGAAGDPAAAREEARFVPHEHDGEARELRRAIGDHAGPVPENV